MTPNPYSHHAVRSLARLVCVLSSLLLALLLLGANPLLTLIHAAPAGHIWPSAAAPATLTFTNETSPAGATGFKFAILAAQWGGEGSGDGQFNQPLGVAVNGAGHVYVADSENHRIQKFDGDGNYLDQWGGVGDGDGQFKYPGGVAVDETGHVYVADTYNHRIQKFDGDGNYLDQWGVEGSGDGQFNGPFGVAVDGAGNVYVADTDNHRIQKFDGDGNYLDQWGGVGQGDGQFAQPMGVAIDGAGHVYVADTYNHRIQKFDGDGNYLAQWGEEIGSLGWYYFPLGVAVDAAGYVYVTDLNSYFIQKFDGDGNYLYEWWNPGSSDSSQDAPIGLAVDGAGHIYVTDYMHHTIQKYPTPPMVVLDDGDSHTVTGLSAGTVVVGEFMPGRWKLGSVVCNGGSPVNDDDSFSLTLAQGDVVTCTLRNVGPPRLTIAKTTVPAGGTNFPFLAELDSPAFVTNWEEFGSGDDRFASPFGVAVDGAGHVYIADTLYNRILKVDGDGNYLDQWGSLGSGDGQFNRPGFVAVDGAGHVYVADRDNNRIQKFDGNGNYLDQWGSPGSGDGQFNALAGVAVDSAGHVYVTDTANNRIQKFDSDGNYLDQWGSHGSGNDQFNYPTGVAVDGAGHVYVADTSNHRIQKFDGDGNYLDQWGSPGKGDGQFNYPSGVAVDAAGYVYVADNANHRIQRYDGNGNYIDEWGGLGNCDDCFTYPTGMATDGKGHVYVADSGNSRIQKFAIWSYLVLDDGHSHTFSNLRPRTVKVSELVPTGWALDDITCDGGSPVEDGNSVSLTLALGDVLTCTFTNTGPGDTTPPSVTINKADGQADPTSASPIHFTAVFSEPVTGFAANDVALASTAGAVTATVTEIAPNNGTSYDVAVSGMNTGGIVIANIGAGAAQDAAGNDNTASTSTDNSVNYIASDTTPPTVTINQAAGQADPTSAGPIHFTAVFSEAVSGFTSSDVAVASTAGAVTAIVTQIAPNNGTTYDVAVSGMNTDGVVVANVGAGAAQDAAGNDNTASTSTDNSVTYIAPDTTPPTVTINQAAGQPDPTNTGPIHFTAIFSEAVSGFTSSDVAVASTAGAVTATVTEIAPNNGTTYDVAVSGMNTDGIVIANIGAGAAQDAAGNDNTASTSTDNSVTYNAPPQTTIATAPPALTNDNDSSFTFSSNEPGGTFECQLDGGDWVACHSGTMSYTDVADGQHTFKVRAIDVAGNTDPEPATHTWTIDTAPPDTTITTGPDDLTTSNDPSFSFTSNETGSSFTCQLDGLPAAPCTTPQSYTDLADGPHTFTVLATDAAGNADASPATDSWTVDTTPPSVTINQAAGQPDPTHAGPIHFTAVFSEAVSGFTGSDVALASTAGAVTAIVTQIAPNNGTTYDVAVSGMNTDGIVVANIGAGAAQDAAGNGNTASTSTDNSVTYKPVLIYITTTGANGTAVNPNGTTVAYTKGDILKWNGQVWSKWFSSAARGLPAGADIYAFDVANEAAGSVWLALGSDQKKVPGLGRVTAHEIVYFNGQSFSRFFDGTDVGLKTSGERVNGLEVLPGSASPIGSNCLHYLLISTVAGGGVPVGSSNVNFTGEDVLGFCMTSMGANTAGQWHLVFEGQSHGLQKNNNRGLSANANATTLYFTAKTAFGAIPAGAIFSWNGSSFSGALWRATDHGVTREVDGIDVVKLGN